jgi:hypothetical protein
MVNQIDIVVNTKPFDDETKLYQRKNFTFTPGLTSLVGCNGSGKSTMIDLYLKPYARKNKIEYIFWNDRRSGGSHLMQQCLDKDDMNGVISLFMSSEGERISYALLDVFRNVGKCFRVCKGQSVIIMFDAIDSGMSVDEICETRDVILDLVIPDAEKQNVTPYFIIAANNYEWCSDPRIHNIDIQTGKSLNINNYDDYKKIILKSRERKDKMRGFNNEND